MFEILGHLPYHLIMHTCSRLEVVTEREDQQTFKGKRDLVSFLSWLDYCDQLTGIANPIVAEALSRTVHQRFLVPCIQQSLLQA